MDFARINTVMCDEHFRSAVAHLGLRLHGDPPLLKKRDLSNNNLSVFQRSDHTFARFVRKSFRFVDGDARFASIGDEGFTEWVFGRHFRTGSQPDEDFRRSTI